MIGSSVDGAPLDDPALDVFWAACCALDVPVFMHPHHELGGERAAAYYLGNLFGNPSETGLIAARLIFAGVFERFPRLNMILAHAGGTLAYIAGRLDHGYRVRPETKALPKPPSAYLSRLYFDTITHDDALLAYLVGRVGAERVVVGTDRPFDMGIDDPRATVAAIPGIDDAARAAILGGNARWVPQPRRRGRFVAPAAGASARCMTAGTPSRKDVAKFSTTSSTFSGISRP